MRRASRNKRVTSSRGGNEKVTYTLMVHGIEYGTGEELVINPECFPDAKIGDLLEISQPDREHGRLILQVASLAPVRGKLQISILKDLAAQFRLEAFHNVVVQKIEPRDVTVDFIELTFKDQFLSRADIWRYKVAMYGKCVYIGKNMELLGIRAQVEALLASNQTLLCGVIGADTKMIVRSRSSRLFWLIQMSTEMWEFAEDGELYYEKLINRLIRILINKWNESSVSHSLTIIAFSRSYYDKNQFPSDYDPSLPIFKEPNRQGFGPGCQASKMAEGYGPNIHVDAEGRYYEDFYKILVMNYCGPDWNHLLQVLKNEFAQYHRSHRWRLPDEFMPVEYEICQSNNNNHKKSTDQPSGQQEALTTATITTSTATTTTTAANNSTSAATMITNPTSSSSTTDTYVQWKSLPYGVPARAVEGNILEAINVTLNILDKHYMDRDLSRTGQGILMITAGSSVFKVEQRLAQITKQRMMDNGVGMDMISLTTPPLHVVPLFIWKRKKEQEDSNDPSTTSGTTHSQSRGTPPSASLNMSTRGAIAGSGPNNDATVPTGSGASGSLESSMKGKTGEEILSSSMPMDKTRGLHSFMDLSTVVGSASPGTIRGVNTTPANDKAKKKKMLNLLDDGDHIYNIPHWVNISFLDFDCKCQESQQKEQAFLPISPQNRSNTSGGMSQQQQQQVQQQQVPKPNTNNRLTHRMCECQWSMNNRFQPLPSFRMFDLTAPMEKLVFPMSLRNIMAFDRRRRDEELSQAQELEEESNLRSSVGSSSKPSSSYSRVNRLSSSGSFSCLLSSEEAEAGKENEKLGNQQEQQGGHQLSWSSSRTGGRKFSDLSDTLCSSLVPSDQWRLSKSPEYDFSLISALNNAVFGSGMGSLGFQGGNGPNSGAILETDVQPHQENALHDRFGALSMTREALQEYDAAVFSPINSSYQTNHAATSTTMGLVGSSSFYAGSISAVAAERSVRGGRSHLGPGLTMVAASLLSPRTEAMIKGRRNQSHQSLRTLPSAATVGSSGSTQLKFTSTPEGGPQRFLSSPTTEMITGVGHPLQNAHTMSLLSKEPVVSPSKGKAIPSTVLEEIHSPACRMLSTSAGSHKDATLIASPNLGTVKNTVSSERLLGKSFESSNVLEKSQQRQAMMRNDSGLSNTEKQTKIKARAFTAHDATLHVSPNLSAANVMRTPPAQSSILDRSPRFASPLSPTFQDSIHTVGPGKGGALSALLGTPSLRRGVSDNASNPGPSSLGTQGGYVGPSGAASAPYYLSYTINPFKFSSDLDGTSQRLTSNRRRWSHLFPAQQSEFQTKIHLGPNWKSLSSPAILPLTTDYYPSPKDLHIMYTESFYTLTLPSTSDDDRPSSTVPKYRNHHELLVEMVCQRLASDFQLVATEAGTDVDVSRHRVPAGSTKRGPSGESRDSQSSIVYHLSMGHRIHQMIYDEELQTIEVKRYFKRASQSQNNEPRVYTYSLWVDATQSFHPFQQRFYEYPQPEDNWNTLDHLLCGYLEDMPDSTKCRRIRFALIPPPLSAFLQEAGKDIENEKEAYVSKFQKFLDYIQSRVTSERKVNVKIVLSAPNQSQNNHSRAKNGASFPPHRRHTYINYKIACDSSTRMKTDTRNEWVVIMLEDTMDISRNYHFDVRWLACSGIMAEEFVSTIKRKAKQAGLELRRIPEYSCVSFLQIHPLIAPVFLPMPHIGGAGSNEHDSILGALLVERLGFVLDDERVADSNGIGYGLGIPREQKSWTKSLSRFQRRSAAANETRMVELWRKRGYKQYMHRHTPIFLRLIHDGIIWIPGYQYDMETDTKSVEELFIEVTNLIQTTTTLHDLTQQVVQQVNT